MTKMMGSPAWFVTYKLSAEGQRCWVLLSLFLLSTTVLLSQKHSLSDGLPGPIFEKALGSNAHREPPYLLSETVGTESLL